MIGPCSRSSLAKLSEATVLAMSDPENLRDDHAELLRRRALTEDAARAESVRRRHDAGGRTARENIADLVDPGSFVEYGRFAIAAQRRRRDVDDLIANTPGDGLVAGTARVNGQRVRGAVLRLHGARRDAGRAGPPQEGPAVRAHRADAAADGVLRRGRRRPARRHRLPGGVVAGRAGVRAVGRPVGRGAADRRRQRPLLRGQRGDRGLLGPHRRHGGHLDRHGRAGDDRRRRARRGRPRRGRPDRGAGAQRRASTSSSPTRPRRSRSPDSCSATSRATAPGGRAGPDRVCAPWFPSAPGAPIRSARSSRRWPTRAR